MSSKFLLVNHLFFSLMHRLKQPITSHRICNYKSKYQLKWKLEYVICSINKSNNTIYLQSTHRYPLPGTGFKELNIQYLWHSGPKFENGKHRTFLLFLFLKTILVCHRKCIGDLLKRDFQRAYEIRIASFHWYVRFWPDFWREL